MKEKMKHPSSLLPIERIARCIYLIRGHKVMLSADLAELYGVEPRTLVQAVKRNLERFPDDFMFQLTRQEVRNLKSQIVISSWGGLRRATPYAFTEQGVAMLSSVLHSQWAVQVNIAIMRAFVRLREFLASQAKLGKKLRDLERKVESHHESIHVLFKAIQQLTSKRPPAIGFHVPTASSSEEPQGSNMVKEARTEYRVSRPRRKRKTK